METNIYLESYKALQLQLENMQDASNVPDPYPIKMQTILKHVTDPVKLTENQLPAVAYAYGRRELNPSLTDTTDLEGESFIVQLYITINKTATEDLVVRSTKMQAAIKLVTRGLKNAAATDDGTVMNCRLGTVLPFREILSDREFLRFEVIFDIISRA